ncbi:MFS transporter [Thiopseudomonas denitrificans]|uniref:Putative MFS family arabinose efflux permease n=1 Tax=Thiopseudomonas denitrificans TaxID=1501432 RepID=A0A4R6U3F8_9GAMM|nr:MFS transporter [Thiopseudomonas denitrificans]TDQ39019.1 putative MFS family arabinose efflux permease [Thiopseudomonas denitrificans]
MNNTTSAPSSSDTQGKRNLWLLVGAQSLGGASPPIIISLGGLVGLQLASDPSLATLPVSLFNLGLALSTIPAAMLMRYLGRRQAYTLGALLAVAAGLVSAYGIAQHSFTLFCIGTTLAGFYAANVQNYRFAASDSVPPAQRPMAISRIMIGGLAAAIIGPQVVIWTRDAWAGLPFAGSFVSQAGLALLALPLLLMLRLPSLQFAVDTGTARPLLDIARQQRFIVAVVAGIVSYGLMAFIMTAAPMAMVMHGYNSDQATLGIQWHVLAMFGPSFFTGKLINRYGKISMTAAGLVIIGLSALLALAGMELLNFWGSLILLGIGWNFGFIGATALVTDTYSQSERSKAQAMNDFLIFGTVAAGSFSSGYLLNTLGWSQINLFMLPVLGAVLLLLWWLHLTGTHRSAQ